jgi:hypothetical protein
MDGDGCTSANPDGSFWTPNGPPDSKKRARTGNSFVAGTLVLMADGSHKPIEDVEIGDKVIATDPTTGTTRTRTVTDTIIGNGEKSLVRVTVDTDGEHVSRTGVITATDGHPFWVGGHLNEWVKAKDLKPGMWLRTSAGTYVQISAIKKWTQHRHVYNLTVDTTHTYYVLADNTPVLVHNSCILYRGDQRSPDTIAAAGGFRARGGTDDLKLYVSSTEPSAFVSTSKSLRRAASFTMNRRQLSGYVYQIEGAPGGIDVNKTIGLRWMLRNAFPGEREVAFKDMIDSQFITAYRYYRGGQPVGDWVPFHGGS